jgi:hypothetical protein
MNAIFIQSYHEELLNDNLQSLINRIFKNLKNKEVKIIIFLNLQSIGLFSKIDIPLGMDVEALYIDEEECRNPTTRIFHFLMNYKIEEFKKILVLESDCFLLKNFDQKIKEYESKLKKPWFIIGSSYYGLMPWMNDKNHSDSRKKHMNGVALYNRTKDFINFVNYVFISNEIEEDNTNYDYALHVHSQPFGLSEQYIDCPYILNISDPKHDIYLSHQDIKPEAVIVHTKNKKYYI